MNHSSELWPYALSAGSILLGAVIQLFAQDLARFIRKRYKSGPVIIKRRETGETAVIPDHYDPEAVDKLIRQLRKEQIAA